MIEDPITRYNCDFIDSRNGLHYSERMFIWDNSEKDGLYGHHSVYMSYDNNDVVTPYVS